MKLNTRIPPIYTHEGATAKHINAEQQLRRSAMACMLWEDSFYEDGQSIAQRIESTIPKVSHQKLSEIAIESREKMKLRHVPLLLMKGLARRGGNIVGDTLERIIQRPDELTEFLAIYWKDGRCPLSAQVKKGLAKAFGKFNDYQLAKYNRDDKVKLRDILFLTHAKPLNKEQEATWKKLVDGNLESPDTWEVHLSSGQDKRLTWERLLTEKKLGALALLRNLRNMREVGVSESIIFQSLATMNVSRVLPFRFIAAARHAPQWEHEIEKAMLRCLQEKPKFPGKTILLVDVSGSMENKLSRKSEITSMDAACGLAIFCREICERVEIWSFSNGIKLIPDRRGFALRDVIVHSQYHGGTQLGYAVSGVQNQGTFDRIIVITDEQSHDDVPNPVNTGYMVNVAAYNNGVGYGPWIHVDGFSESILDYIYANESN